jgi:DUF917 family protein
MPHRQLKTRQDCKDFVRGCTIMGIGGGGMPDVGLKVLLEAFDEGVTLEWIDVDDITDDSWTACVYGMGSTAPISDETKAEIKKLGLKPVMAGKEMEAALKELADYTGITLSAMVSPELGGSNTPEPLVAAARMGLALSLRQRGQMGQCVHPEGGPGVAYG